MKKQKTAEIRQSKLTLPIFSALCALFASGAIIGITLLSSPALQWRLFTALLPEYAVCFAVAFIVVYGYGSILPKIAYLSLPISCLACGVRTVYKSAPYVSPLAVSFVFALLCAATIAACIWALGQSHIPKKQEKTALSTAFAVLGALAAAAASLALFAFIVNGRLESLQTAGTPIAQIGQMLYYMQHSGQAFTTLGSGVPESYFATQLAPLWYLLLPVYIVFDHSMLAVGVAMYALMLSGLVPLWRICRRHALSAWQSAALCAACALCPLLLGGGSTGGALAMLSLPLLLWVADALESKHPYLALIPLVLCLCIGFEVTVWALFICLYLTLAGKQNRRAGLICTAVAGAALIATTVYLAVVGSPVLTTLFTGIGLQMGKKLLFLALLLLPFALLPLLTKQKAALVLLFPVVLFHFVANALTYSGVFCAYAFPAVAAAALLAAKGAAQLRTVVKGVSLARLLPALALCIAALCTTTYAATLIDLYASPEEQAETDAARIYELLDTLPDNAAVTASDSLLAALHDRTWLFSLDADPAHPTTNVIVLDLREEFTTSDTEQYGVAYYKSLGYTLRSDLSRDGILAVLYK